MGYVYLIRNGDLHKIGRTDNLQRRMKQLKPDQVVAVLETDRSRDLELELHRKLKAFRIPQTEYFRLGEAELNLARVELGWEPDGPVSFPAAHLVDQDVAKAKTGTEEAALLVAACVASIPICYVLLLLNTWWSVLLGICVLVASAIYFIPYSFVLAVNTINYLGLVVQHHLRQRQP
jgi:hypothetical protein